MTLTNTLLTQIQTDNPRQAKMLAASTSSLTPQEQRDLETYLTIESMSGTTTTQLSSAYNLIVLDTLREQMFFRRNGRYRYQRFDDVASEVYFSEEYMRSYMQGLALTGFLWPNHVAIRRFFHEGLRMHAAPKGAGLSYLEVGPGHGLFMTAALRTGAFERCMGVDISPTSLALTRQMLEHAGVMTPHVQLACCDFLAGEGLGSEGFDIVVMGEILEHVENPQAFLERAFASTKRGARVFVSTCVNSPARDHIYLYAHHREVRAMLEASGFRVADEIVVPYHGTTVERSYQELLPINVAYWLER